MDDQAMRLCGGFVEKYLDKTSPLTIVDVGSFNVNGAYRGLFNAQEWRYFGLDIVPGDNVDFVAKDEYLWNFPILCDVAISGQCLEHVRMPWIWIQSVVKLVRPDGLIFVQAPNTWPYHEFPLDCWRIFPDGMKALFEWGGIEALEVFAEGPATVGIGRKM